MIELNKIYNIDCVAGMKMLEEESIDLTVTSPPYDDMRTYNGFKWNFEETAKELYRVAKQGGVVVWVVGDKIIKGNKTLTSFKQALFFQNIGFNVHDVMIYKKKNTPFMRTNAYTNCFEFMFIFSKGTPKTFNPLKEKTVRNGKEMLVCNKKADGVNHKVLKTLNTEKTKINIWEYAVGLGGTTKDKIAFKHPAVFPEQLAKDHIITWSNKGDIVLDCFMGSGTTAKMALETQRGFIGFELSKDYCDIAEERLNIIKNKM